MRLIGLLSDAQQKHGYLSQQTLRVLAREANVPLHRLQQLVSFYPHFRTTPPPRVELALCRDMSCYLAGAEGCAKKLKELDGVEAKEVSCIGRCDHAPAGMLNHEPIPLSDLEQVKAWVARPETVPTFDQPLPSRWRIDPYPSPESRYGAFRKLVGMSRAEGEAWGLSELKAAGVRGMGGAGFPAGSKWALVKQEPRFPKYVICNADESEPGTFKDAKILADLPHLVLEGMMIAAYTLGAQTAIVYLRHEYEAERKRLSAAIEKARGAGLLGSNVLGTGATIDIEIFVSPGGYILGEETALLEALEDKRGEPRNKPPFPGTHGLHGQPTLINNVETFAHIPGILMNGGEWWKAQGVGGCAGLKFIAVSGHVERPGVYEVPLGTTVRELIELAGGVKDRRKLLAFAPGGASSNVLPADKADVKLDFNELAKAGSMLGSGALVVVAEGTDLLALATNVVKFFRNESCGKCVPCRVGSQKAVELLEAVLTGSVPRTALDVLPELGETMTLTSICGLGQVAVNPVLSVLKNFPDVTSANR
ncbi:MAG TPA: NADH-ubiquinone oxidoreductase-F iron-sulfur binding region domain-containing protein [Gemmataceae bacterium]|nr:NADH-ubiquinone oxidoreductase-F iron-sulfur binding region domain-containing protein [Gemmataceae bacterium]